MRHATNFSFFCCFSFHQRKERKKNEREKRGKAPQVHVARYRLAGELLAVCVGQQVAVTTAATVCRDGIGLSMLRYTLNTIIVWLRQTLQPKCHSTITSLACFLANIQARYQTN